MMIIVSIILVCFSTWSISPSGRLTHLSEITEISVGKSLDMSNPLSTEDEGGLATPPMDVGALFLVSQDTAIMQNVSEVPINIFFSLSISGLISPLNHNLTYLNLISLWHQVPS